MRAGHKPGNGRLLWQAVPARLPTILPATRTISLSLLCNAVFPPHTGLGNGDYTFYQARY